MESGFMESKVGYKQETSPLGADPLTHPFGFYHYDGEYIWGTFWYESIDALKYDFCHGRVKETFYRGDANFVPILENVKTWDELKNHTTDLKEPFAEFRFVTLEEYMTSLDEFYKGFRMAYWEDTYELEEEDKIIPPELKIEFAEWVAGHVSD